VNAEQAVALLLLVLFVGPVLHVALSPKGGPWKPTPGSRCPFGPRLGWLAIVLMLGPVGWVMYLSRRRTRAAKGR
jgi:hypothetical protein